MNLRKIIQKRIRRSGGGVDVVSDINAAVAANVGERGTQSATSSQQVVVNQRSRAEAHATPAGEGRKEERP